MSDEFLFTWFRAVCFPLRCNHLLPGILYRRRKETIRPGEQNQPPTLSSQDDTFLENYPKSMPSQEERLPMLMKGTIFRTSTGEYTDICEMHDLSTMKEYSLSMNACTCGTCSPANVRRIHIPPPRLENTATLPTFRTFSGGISKEQQLANQKIYDTARGLKSVKLVDRNSVPSAAPSSSSLPPPAPQYYFQLDANNVNQQVGDNRGEPDLVQAQKTGEQPNNMAAQYVAMPRQEKKS
jgi:hypothetical protein